jgi:TrmH family RNA methyltransferase
MPYRLIHSKQNARLKELRHAFLKPGREAHGLAAIEGANLLEEALRAQLHIPCIFVGEEEQSQLASLPLPASTEVLLVRRPLLDSVLQTETPQPVAALVEIPDWTLAHMLGPALTPPLVLVLAGLQDPGNLGTILRSAEAFGATGILALPGTVSPWSPKAIRASAGSVFRLPFVFIAPDDCFANLREAGLRILTTTVHAAQPIDLIDLTGPVAFLIGNEGNGVPPHIAVHADQAITIPCPGPVESLNAAVATSILLYEASRQSQAVAGGPGERRGATR